MEEGSRRPQALQEERHKKRRTEIRRGTADKGLIVGQAQQTSACSLHAATRAGIGQCLGGDANDLVLFVRDFAQVHVLHRVV